MSKEMTSTSNYTTGTFPSPNPSPPSWLLFALWEHLDSEEWPLPVFAYNTMHYT